MNPKGHRMNRKIPYLITFVLMLLYTAVTAAVSNAVDKDYSECVNTIEKFPYAHLIDSLKQNNDFFIAVISYNSTWGMFPSYVYLQKNVGLEKNKANVVLLSKKQCEEISALTKEYIIPGGQVFIKGGQNSLPTRFHAIVIYNKGVTTSVIISQVSNKITDRYENNTYTDKPFQFLAKLATLTNSEEMFESIYGFWPFISK